MLRHCLLAPLAALIPASVPSQQPPRLLPALQLLLQGGTIPLGPRMGKAVRPPVSLSSPPASISGVRRQWLASWRGEQGCGRHGDLMTAVALVVWQDALCCCRTEGWLEVCRRLVNGSG